MKKIFALFCGLFLAFTLLSQTSKTGIAVLLPVENVVQTGTFNELTGKQDAYPQYQRWKLLEVNPLTLLPNNPSNPVSVLLYVKIKDATAKEKMDSIIGVVKNEPVVLDGTMYKEKMKKKIQRKGDVEITEVFQVDNWAPLKLAKQRMGEVTGQVLVDAQKLDSALQVTDQVLTENERLLKENEQLKADAQKEKLVQQKEKQPVKANIPPPTKEQRRRQNIAIPAVKPSGT